MPTKPKKRSPPTGVRDTARPPGTPTAPRAPSMPVPGSHVGMSQRSLGDLTYRFNRERMKRSLTRR